LRDSTLTGLTKSVGPLAVGTGYFWRVLAKNPGGTSAWSLARKFTTIPPAPGVPVPSAPAQNATDVAVSTSLSWSAVSGAATYAVELSIDSTFAILDLQDSGVTATTRGPPCPASPPRLFRCPRSRFPRTTPSTFPLRPR
jgi:hypothetical protein